MTTIPDVEPPDTKSDFDSPPICFYCYDLIRYSAFSENDAGAMYITLLQRSLHPNLCVNDADSPYHSTNTRIWKCRVLTLLMIPTLRGTTFLHTMIPDSHSFMTTYEILIGYRIHSLRFLPKMAEEPYPESIATVFCFFTAPGKKFGVEGSFEKAFVWRSESCFIV